MNHMGQLSNAQLFVALLSSAILLRWAYHFARTWSLSGPLERFRAGRPVPPGIKNALRVLCARLMFSFADLIFGPPVAKP